MMSSDICGCPALSAAGLARNGATSFHTRISRVTTAINRRTHPDVDSSEDVCLKEREIQIFIQQPVFSDFSTSEKEKKKLFKKRKEKNTTSHMYIPTGRSVPRTGDLLERWKD